LLQELKTTNENKDISINQYKSVISTMQRDLSAKERELSKINNDMDMLTSKFESELEIINSKFENEVKSR